MRATQLGGELIPLDKCVISIPGIIDIIPNTLPDISDTKSAEYSDENIIGRSFPLKTYSHSGNRAISITLHCYITTQGDVNLYLRWLRAIQSCVYPTVSATDFAPFAPPKIVQIKCGKLLTGTDTKESQPLCCVLKSYTVKFPIDVAWDEETYLPWKFDIDTSWDVVYSSSELPTDDRIINFGA